MWYFSTLDKTVIAPSAKVVVVSKVISNLVLSVVFLVTYIFLKEFTEYGRKK